LSNHEKIQQDFLCVKIPKGFFAQEMLCISLCPKNRFCDLSKTTSQRLVECIYELQHQVVFEHVQKFSIIQNELAFSHQLVSEMLRISEHIKNPLIFNETGRKFLTF